MWLYKVIDQLDFHYQRPINRSGEDAADSWLKADFFAESHDKVINLVEPYDVTTNLPSTIVLLTNGKFKILRQGLCEIDPVDIEV